MPTSLVAAAVTAFGWLAGETVLAFVARTVLFTGISRIIAKRSLSQSNSAAASGRTQQAPVANNVLPVVYGTAFIPPTVTDAKISTDQKYMWYVCALAEHTDTTVSSGYTFGDIYYDGKLVTFDGTDTSKVTKLTTNGDTPQEDTNIAGKLYIWKFPNGSTSGISTGGSNAITLLSDTSTGGGIPAGERWNGPIYTYTEGLVTYSPTMSNTAFIIIRVEYNEDAGLSGLGQVQVELTNTITKPGDALKDYLLNSRYGCAVPLAKIDTASLTALNTYSDELVTYTPVGGGSATQVRYRINGPLDPANDCLTNLQQLVDACDSWLQYSELTGTWGVVINQSYTDYTTLNDLFLVDSSNLIGGINVNPIDLNSIYNEMEVQYPDYNVQDQYNFPVIKLQDYYPQWMSPNEPINRINLNYPQVNNNIQARYLGVRRLLQGRLDLTVNFTLDFSGIQLVAGDVIKINLAEYGWGPTTLDPSNPSQLFRVSNVQEQKNQDGNLFAVITAFQYDDDVYNDDPLTDFVLDGNTGLSDPNIIDKPTTPIIYNGPIANGAINYYSVSSNVPASGSVLYMDFNVGNSSNVQTHKSYSSVQIGDGTPYTANSTITINVSDSDPGTYYWSTTARNEQAGRQSNSSSAFAWVGPAVTSYNVSTFVCANSAGNVVTTVESTANVRIGMNVAVTGGTGAVAANTLVTSVNSANTFTINPSPTTAFSCATLKVGGGGITYNQMSPSLGLSQGIGGSTFTITQSGLLPVNVTSTATRNIPVYIQGAGYGPNSLYPFYQGTSLNTNANIGNTFYGANSTGSFTPNLASTLAINDGEDNWWKILFDDFTAGTLTNDEQYNLDFGYQIVSDTDNTLIQVVPAIKIASEAYYQADTQYMNAVVLYADLPTTFVYRKNSFGGASAYVGGAVFFRVLTGGSTVYVVTGSIASSKSPKSYF